MTHGLINQMLLLPAHGWMPYNDCGCSKRCKWVTLICCVCVYVEDFAPDKPEVSVREHILQDLENFIQKQFAGELTGTLLFLFYQILVLTFGCMHKSKFRIMMSGPVPFCVLPRSSVLLSIGKIAAVWLIQEWIWLPPERPGHLHGPGRKGDGRRTYTSMAWNPLH